jgi:regulator of sigma E protease
MMAFLHGAAFYAPFLLVITVIVTIHELGHFATAKAFGVAIDRFSIGFGRALVSWRDRSGVEWRLGWLPLGGYVRFAGDDNAASIPDQTDLEALRSEIRAREGVGAERRYLYFKPLWQRTLIVLAGPAANFVLAIALFALVFGLVGQPMTSTRIDRVIAGSAAARGGFQGGDVLIAADGRPIRSFEDLQFYVQYRAGIPIAFTVRRAGRIVRLSARPDGVQEKSPFGGKESIGMLGLTARGGFVKHFGPFESVVMGARKTWGVTTTTIFYLGRIVTGQVGADQLHSFVGIAHASGDITRQAVETARTEKVSVLEATGFFLVQLTAFLSVSIGLLNLMPIPILDGGHLLFYGYEAIARRPAAAGIQAVGYRVGLALLVGLMLFATWNDLQRLRVFQFFGSLFS